MIPYATKKLLTIFFGFFISQLLPAQQRYQLDSVVNHWSHYEVHTQISQQEYDAENRILTAQNEVTGIAGERDEGTRQTIQYDARNNELIRIDSYWNKEKKQWTGREKRVKTYDDNDRMLSDIRHEMQHGQWVAITKNIHAFEERSVTNTRYRKVDGQWIPIHKKVMLSDENDKETLTFCYQWDNAAGDWAYWMQHENIFVRDSLLQESVSYTWKNGQWTNSEKTVYTYVPQTDKVTDRVVYTGTDDGWQFKHLTQIKYYPAVRREEIFNWSERDNDWRAETFKEIYTDQYDRDTDFVLFAWDVDSGEYRRHAQGMTVRDGQDRITQVQEIRYDNGRMDSGTEILIDFDKDGNLYRQTRRALIGKRWIPQETTEFTFDSDIFLRNERGKPYVADLAKIAHENTEKNRHAIDSIRSYRHLDGEMVLQEEWKYYYSRCD